MRTGRVHCSWQGIRFRPRFLSSYAKVSSFTRFWFGHNLKLSSFRRSLFLTSCPVWGEMRQRARPLALSSPLSIISILSCVFMHGAISYVFPVSRSPEMQAKLGIPVIIGRLPPGLTELMWNTSVTVVFPLGL